MCQIKASYTFQNIFVTNDGMKNNITNLQVLQWHKPEESGV